MPPIDTEEALQLAALPATPETAAKSESENRVDKPKGRQIRFKGNRWFKDRLLKQELGLQGDEPADYKHIEMQLKTISNHRDIRASLLTPDPADPDGELVVEIQDKLPVHLSAFVHNLGTVNTGRVRAGPSLTFTNLTGNLDRLTAAFEIGNRTHQVSADYHIPVKKTGSVPGLRFARAQIDAARNFELVDLTAAVTTYTAYLTQPLFEKKYLQATTEISGDWKRVRTDSITGSRGKDDLRILNALLSLKSSDRFGITAFQHKFSFGFDRFLGASTKDDPHMFVPGSGGQFFIYRGTLLRNFTLPWDITLHLRGHVQLTPDSLSILEKMRLGGHGSVRGFLEAERLPDFGGHGSTEIRIPAFLFPSGLKLPFSERPIREQFQAVGFVDFGAGGAHDRSRIEHDHRYLTGIGGGLRIALEEHTYARFEWGTPVRGSKRDGSDSTFHFGIYMELF